MREKKQGTCSESDVDEFWIFWVLGYQTCILVDLIFLLITPSPTQQPHPSQTTSQITASNVFLRFSPLRGIVVILDFTEGWSQNSRISFQGFFYPRVLQNYTPGYL